MMSCRSWQKTVSFFIAISFLITNTSQASFINALKPSQGQYQDLKIEGDLSSSKQLEVTDPEQIIISENIGRVKEFFRGETNRLIINIQDAHCNFEAQTNISNILDALSREYGIKLVALEGSSGDIDPSLFTSFPDDEIRKEVATYFLRKGKINGAEYLAITSKTPPKLYGVETKEYYLENLAAFTNTLEGRQNAKAGCGQVRAVLDKLKAYIYSRELKVFDEKVSDYKKEKISLIDFCKYLKEAASSKRIPINNMFPNLGLLYKAVEIEGKINFTKVDGERSILISSLEKVLSQNAVEELFSKSVDFKSGTISASRYYNFLRVLTQNYQIDFTQFPNLDLYVNYLVIYDKVDTYNLLVEMAALEDAVKEKLFQNETQRRLSRLSRHIQLLEGMLDISLSKEDVEYYQKNKDDFRAQAFLDFIKEQAPRYNVRLSYDPNFLLIDKCLPDLENFYRIADKRDDAIIENTLKKMEEEKFNVVALITGGYHTKGIAERLRDKGVSYIIIAPRITKADLNNPYLSILSEEKEYVRKPIYGGDSRNR